MSIGRASISIFVVRGDVDAELLSDTSVIFSRDNVSLVAGAYGSLQ
jgi:hypothetical protein